MVIERISLDLTQNSTTMSLESVEGCSFFRAPPSIAVVRKNLAGINVSNAYIQIKRIHTDSTIQGAC